MKVSIIGSGIFGVSIANKLVHNGYKITMWTNKENTSSIVVPKEVTITNDISAATLDMDVIFIMIGAKYYSETIKLMKPYYKDSLIVICSKGLDETGNNLYDLCKDTLNTDNISILYGPTLAIDVKNLEPLGFTFASENKENTKLIEALFKIDKIEYTNKDSFNKDSLSLMTNSLPIVSAQNIEDKERIIYNIDTSNIYNDASGFSDKTFNSRYDYGMHYYISLYNTEEGTEPNGENEDINGNKYVIDNNKTGLTFNGLLDSMKYTMFNGDMMALIYGSILNNTINLMQIQHSGNNSSLCTFSSYSNSGIGLSYNIILPLNGYTNSWYEYAFATPRNNISISKKNIYNKNSESLNNYIKINENKFREEIIDPNTGQSYD